MTNAISERAHPAQPEDAGVFDHLVRGVRVNSRIHTVPAIFETEMDAIFQLCWVSCRAAFGNLTLLI